MSVGRGKHRRTALLLQESTVLRDETSALVEAHAVYSI